MTISILSKIGLPVLMNVLSGALKTIDTPVTKGAADAIEAAQDALRAGQIPDAQIIEANRHIEKIAEMESAENRATLAEINQTARTEIASNDAYVRRMRPTFGYLMAVSWTAQMIALAYIIVFETDKAGFVLQAMGSLSAIWAVGLSVLGIYVYKRSEEKRASMAAGGPIYWSGPRKG